MTTRLPLVIGAANRVSEADSADILNAPGDLRTGGGVVADGVLDLGILTSGIFGAPLDLTGVGVIVFSTGTDITFRSWGAAGQIFAGAGNAHRRVVLAMRNGAGSCTLGSGFGAPAVLRAGQAVEVWCDPYPTAPAWRVLRVDVAGEIAAALTGYATTTYVDAAIADLPKRLTYIFDGGGETLTAGMRYEIPLLQRGGTVTRWAILAPAGQIGSCVVDLLRGTSPHPTGSITGTEPPRIDSANAAIGTTLSGWSKGLAVGDYVVAEIVYALDFTALTLTIDY